MCPEKGTRRRFIGLRYYSLDSLSYEPWLGAGRQNQYPVRRDNDLSSKLHGVSCGPPSCKPDFDDSR